MAKYASLDNLSSYGSLGGGFYWAVKHNPERGIIMMMVMILLLKYSFQAPGTKREGKGKMCTYVTNSFVWQTPLLPAAPTILCV